MSIEGNGGRQSCVASGSSASMVVTVAASSQIEWRLAHGVLESYELKHTDGFGLSYLGRIGRSRVESHGTVAEMVKPP